MKSGTETMKVEPMKARSMNNRWLLALSALWGIVLLIPCLSERSARDESLPPKALPSDHVVESSTGGSSAVNSSSSDASLEDTSLGELKPVVARSNESSVHTQRRALQGLNSGRESNEHEFSGTGLGEFTEISVSVPVREKRRSAWSESQPGVPAETQEMRAR